jgi:nucleoid-associated protein YgaU
MSGGSEMLRSRFSPRAAVLALVSVGVAACSADATRFNDNPFASHSNPELTASMPQAQTAQAPQPPLKSAAPGPGRSGTSEVTRSVLRETTSSPNWSWDGGTAITVAAGETIDTIARRYGVPASVIMQANNITAPATLYPGQRLVIPRYTPSRVATAPIR